MAASESSSTTLTDEATRTKGTVCVTGASGFCGSWLVMRLLQRGYKVRATVRDPANKAKTSHLWALPGAAERLEIFKGDLLDQGDFDKAVSGCEGVFHVASPVIFQPNDPETDVIQPAVQGTLCVLKACAKDPSVRCVVYTSTAGAVAGLSNNVPHDQVVDESCWTSVELCNQEKLLAWAYVVSKTLAEQKAFEFAKENHIDLVSINPSLIVGPFVTPEIPYTVAAALAWVKEPSSQIRRTSYVHVDDVAMAHIFIYEHPSASGRYICSAKDALVEEVAEMLRQRHPELTVATEFKRDGIFSPLYASEKLKKLGYEYKYNLEDMFDHAIECCKEKALLDI